MRSKEAQFAHARDEFQRECTLAEVGDDGGIARLDEVAHGVAHLAFVVGELGLDVQKVYATVGLHGRPRYVSFQGVILASAAGWLLHRDQGGQ